MEDFIWGISRDAAVQAVSTIIAVVGTSVCTAWFTWKATNPVPSKYERELLRLCGYHNAKFIERGAMGGTDDAQIVVRGESIIVYHEFHYLLILLESKKCILKVADASVSKLAGGLPHYFSYDRFALLSRAIGITSLLEES